MSFYADRHIKVLELKKWASELSIENIHEVNHAGDLVSIDDKMKQILSFQLQGFISLVEVLEEDDDWRDIKGVCSPLFYDAFFKVNDNAIKIANYYECLVVASDIETKKKIIKGFDLFEMGAVNLYNGDNAIGCIGEKSDLLWSVLYDYFIFKDEYGYVKHTIPNHEEYMAIQLINVAGLSLEEIEHYVQEILLKCSIELGLNFKVVKLNKKIKKVGEDSIFQLSLNDSQYEYIPLVYLTNAIQSNDVRLSYLSYYQVLEYFFIRAQNYKLIDDLRTGNFLTTEHIEHRDLKRIMKKYVSTLTERESLKLVLKRSLSVCDIKNWINESQERVNHFTRDGSQTLIIDLSKTDEKIIGKIAERIYYYRCSIAHAKGDADEYLAIPEQSESVIKKELPLMKIISLEVLKKCSEA